MWQKMLQIGSGGGTPTKEPLILYESGDEKGYGWRATYNPSGTTFSKLSNALRISVTATDSLNIMTNQKISLNGYSSLKIDCTFSGSNVAYDTIFGGYSETVLSTWEYPATSKTIQGTSFSGTLTYEMNTSVEAYIFAGVNCQGTMNITKIWLE